MRTYLLMLVPMSIFCMMYLYHKNCCHYCFDMYHSTPFHVIAHYGNEEVDYVRLSIIHGSDFLAKYCPDGYTVGHEGFWEIQGIRRDLSH